MAAQSFDWDPATRAFHVETVGLEAAVYKLRVTVYADGYTSKSVEAGELRIVPERLADLEGRYTLTVDGVALPGGNVVTPNKVLLVSIPVPDQGVDEVYTAQLYTGEGESRHVVAQGAWDADARTLAVSTAVKPGSYKLDVAVSAEGFESVGITPVDIKVTSEFVTETIDGREVLVEYNGLGGDVTIPAADIEGNSIAAIGPRVFSGNEALTSASIPATVTEIQASAFEGCVNLARVDIPNGVTAIREKAFKGCAKLSEMSDSRSAPVLNGYDQIVDLTINHCRAGNEYVLLMLKPGAGSDGIQTEDILYINEFTAADGAIHTASVLPDCDRFDAAAGGVFTDGATSPRMLGSFALTALPDALEVIEAEAFKGTAFTHIYLGGSVTSIGSQAFSGCPALEYVYIPTSAASIAADAADDSPNAVIGCAPDSRAHGFAQSSGLPFRLVE